MIRIKKNLIQFLSMSIITFIAKGEWKEMNVNGKEMS